MSSKQDGGPNALANGSVSVGPGTATLLVAARASRRKLLIAVANNVYIGDAGVTVANGFPLSNASGPYLELETADAVYAVSTSTFNIGYIELYDI